MIRQFSSYSLPIDQWSRYFDFVSYTNRGINGYKLNLIIEAKYFLNFEHIINSKLSQPY